MTEILILTMAEIKDGIKKLIPEILPEIGDQQYGDLTYSWNIDELSDQSEYQVIFIQPELFFKDQDFSGYKFLLTKIFTWSQKRSTPPQICFLSFFTHEYLMKLFSGNRRILEVIKTFPHYYLYNLPKERVNYNISVGLFELVRFLYLENQQIALLIHDLTNYINNPSAGAGKWAEFYNQLLALEVEITEKTFAKVIDINQSLLNGRNIIPKIKELILQLRDTRAFKETQTYPYNVLIIDDDPKFSDFLLVQYQKYFNHVDVLHVTKEIEMEAIITEIKDYDIILIDILYQNDKFYFDFCGVDLIRWCETSTRSKVLRIFTQLPRRTVAKLLGRENLVGIFPKMYQPDMLGDFIDADIVYLVKEYNKKKKTEFTEAITPKNGPFSTENYFGQHVFKLFQLDPEEFKNKYWIPAKRYAEEFLQEGEIKSNGWQNQLCSAHSYKKCDPNYVEINLPIILAHRLLFLAFAKVRSGKVVWERYKLKISRVYPTISDNIKGYVNSYLGFCLDKNGIRDGKATINLSKGLFQFELDWLNALDIDSVRIFKKKKEGV